MAEEYKNIKDAILIVGDDIKGSCPGIYVKDNETYVIVGKLIDVKKAGIEQIVGEGEVAIEFPKSLVKHAP